MKYLIQFGRIGVVKKPGKQAKMQDKGYPAVMVGYTLNHGAGTYRLYNPKTKRIIMSRDVTWMSFQSRKLDDEFNMFEPGIKSEESVNSANSSITTHKDAKSLPKEDDQDT